MSLHPDYQITLNQNLWSMIQPVYEVLGDTSFATYFTAYPSGLMYVIGGTSDYGYVFLDLLYNRVIFEDFDILSLTDIYVYSPVRKTYEGFDARNNLLFYISKNSWTFDNATGLYYIRLTYEKIEEGIYRFKYPGYDYINTNYVRRLIFIDPDEWKYTDGVDLYSEGGWTPEKINTYPLYKEEGSNIYYTSPGTIEQGKTYNLLTSVGNLYRFNNDNLFQDAFMNLDEETSIANLPAQPIIRDDLPSYNGQTLEREQHRRFGSVQPKAVVLDWLYKNDSGYRDNGSYLLKPYSKKYTKKDPYVLYDNGSDTRSIRIIDGQPQVIKLDRSYLWIGGLQKVYRIPVGWEVAVYNRKPNQSMITTYACSRNKEKMAQYGDTNLKVYQRQLTPWPEGGVDMPYAIYPSTVGWKDYYDRTGSLQIPYSSSFDTTGDRDHWNIEGEKCDNYRVYSSFLTVIGGCYHWKQMNPPDDDRFISNDQTQDPYSYDFELPKEEETPIGDYTLQCWSTHFITKNNPCSNVIQDNREDLKIWEWKTELIDNLLFTDTDSDYGVDLQSCGIRMRLNEGSGGYGHSTHLCVPHHLVAISWPRLPWQSSSAFIPSSTPIMINSVRTKDISKNSTASELITNRDPEENYFSSEIYNYMNRSDGNFAQFINMTLILTPSQPGILKNEPETSIMNNINPVRRKYGEYYRTLDISGIEDIGEGRTLGLSMHRKVKNTKSSQLWTIVMFDPSLEDND